MRISDWSSDVCSSDLGGGIGEAGAHVGHQVAQGAETGKDALDVGIEVGEEAVRLGGVGGTASATGSRGRRVGGHVQLGRVELAGRGIVAIGPAQIDLQSVVKGQGVSVRVILGVRRNFNNKNNYISQ